MDQAQYTEFCESRQLSFGEIVITPILESFVCIFMGFMCDSAWKKSIPFSCAFIDPFNS